jgi:IMP dehydrogenase/GMP reductase
MRIEEDVKLDFRDVLIRPKRSTLGSRSEVDITRAFQLKHTGIALAGVPVMASNMDTVGTFAMARALAEQGCWTVLHKFYPVEAMAAFFAEEPAAVLAKTWYSMGATAKDLARFREIDRLVASRAGDERRPRHLQQRLLRRDGLDGERLSQHQSRRAGGGQEPLHRPWRHL